MSNHTERWVNSRYVPTVTDKEQTVVEKTVAYLKRHTTAKWNAHSRSGKEEDRVEFLAAIRNWQLKTSVKKYLLSAHTYPKTCSQPELERMVESVTSRAAAYFKEHWRDVEASKPESST